MNELSEYSTSTKILNVAELQASFTEACSPTLLTQISELASTLDVIKFPPPLHHSETVQNKADSFQNMHSVTCFGGETRWSVFIAFRKHCLHIGWRTWAFGAECARYADMAKLFFEKYRKRGAPKFNYSREQAAADMQNVPDAVELLRCIEVILLREGIITTPAPNAEPKLKQTRTSAARRYDDLAIRLTELERSVFSAQDKIAELCEILDRATRDIPRAVTESIMSLARIPTPAITVPLGASSVVLS